MTSTFSMSSLWLLESTSWSSAGSRSSKTCLPIGRLADGNCQTLRQSPASQRTIVAHCVDNSANYHRGVLSYELATHAPAAWIEVFEQRLSLWCQQQLQQLQRPPLSLVPPGVHAHGAQGIAEAYVRDQLFSVDSRPCHVGASAWFLFLCVLELLPTGRSAPEVTQRPLVPSGRAPPHIISSFVYVAPVCFRSVSGTLTWRMSERSIRLCCSCFTLARLRSKHLFSSNQRTCRRVVVLRINMAIVLSC